MFFSTNNSNLQFHKKLDLVGFVKEESIYLDIEIKENSTVLFIGNDANEMFILSNLHSMIMISVGCCKWDFTQQLEIILMQNNE